MFCEGVSLGSYGGLFVDSVSLPVKQVWLGKDDETAVTVGFGAQKKKWKKKNEDESEIWKKKETNCGWGISPARQAYTLPEIGAGV